ncbi:Toluene-4-monooxygenase system protein B (TmoB) [Mycobacterium lentiflavum]|uniref:Toluene-4-monooxygenase system B family protein n=1 Tax=Mycobacterium lentiflavum TaxID=141349 RepID=A0A0E4CNE8_MYCLN|nr:toluene-4-monooxygenase system B family protein [Mycobacterium lentiflavum]MEE3065385.1 toluene-4-monooxygenase system B family protein [Actinomycetota bacterium]ULP44823.1 toluene-4-monooxygenase system B family protein [Mycobacterium lentiflavum]CQD14042.1 Toluene-4-monooxygenase system protein B (TmoB) [Mycobacterium lentiflavum]
MALLPLTANFEGDVLELLIPVDDADTVEHVGQQVAHHVVGHRVPRQDAPLHVRHEGRILASDTIIGASGVEPMDHLEVFYGE